MGNTTLSLCVTPQSFFKEEFDKARASLKCSVDQDVEFYVVNLLCEFIDPTKIEKVLNTDGNFLERPLALILKDAVEAPEFQRALILRRLGDVSLYLSGFFQDYFNRRTFDVGYYIELGSSAYDQVADLQKSRGEGAIERIPYSLMARDFLKLVDVLSQISDSFSAQSKDTLVLYDRWVRSGSTRLLKLLEDQGIAPIPNISKNAQ